MSLKISTGVRDHLLVTGSFKAAVDGGVIRVYNGTPPATADAALAGNTLLVTISNNSAGTGITMDSASASGVLGKNPAEVWSGTVVANGTPTFYRYSSLTDDFLLSTTAKRVQGTTGSAGFDLNFANTTFTVSEVKRIDTYDIAQPTA
jgi:hypothetical protein